MENAPIKSFRDLKVWQEAHSLVVEIYKITKDFPKDEVFGLTNQIRRASVSITSNISEGFNRVSQKEKVHFYFIALGSLAEVESQILIAKDVGYLNPSISGKIEVQIIVIQRLLNALIKKIKSVI
jgi:four helix bundle protein